MGPDAFIKDGNAYKINQLSDQIVAVKLYIKPNIKPYYGNFKKVMSKLLNQLQKFRSFPTKPRALLKGVIKS